MLSLVTVLVLVFYAYKINAFSSKDFVTMGDMEAVYRCNPAITFAVVCGIVEICLLGFTITAFVCRKRFG